MYNNFYQSPAITNLSYIIYCLRNFFSVLFPFVVNVFIHLSVSIVFIVEVVCGLLFFLSNLKLIIDLIMRTVQVARAVERVLNVQMLSNILGLLTSVLVTFCERKSNLAPKMGTYYMLLRDRSVVLFH